MCMTYPGLDRICWPASSASYYKLAVSEDFKFQGMKKK